MMRRGTLESLTNKPELLSDRFTNMSRLFNTGDIVESSLSPGLSYGIVESIDEKTKTINVVWSSGMSEQVNQDEIQLAPSVTPEIQDRIRKEMSLNTRRMAGKSNAIIPPEFISDPKLHGMKDSRGGGFSIMQDLQEDLHEESLENVVKASIDYTNLHSRRAVYHKEKGRVYQMSKSESETGTLRCPRCKQEGLERQPFTRGVGIYVCPSCGWKITTDNIL
jgi:predicted RNA-binding Zn-ribbon protein involved in translation (DUF1610 family)